MRRETCRLPPAGYGRNQFGVVEFNLAAENLDRFASHEDVVRANAAFAPFDFQRSAAQFDRRAPRGSSGQDGSDQRRARARAASERFARPALPYAHPQAIARDRQDEFGVDAPRKKWMALEL